MNPPSGPQVVFYFLLESNIPEGLEFEKHQYLIDVLFVGFDSLRPSQQSLLMLKILIHNLMGKVNC